MTTLFSKEYYENNQEKFDSMRGVVTPEEDLVNELKIFSELPIDAQKKLEQIYAKQIIDRITKELLVAKDAYTKVRINPSCLGYSNLTQQTQQAHKLVTMFEYNCWKLSQFKKKYL